MVLGGSSYKHFAPTELAQSSRGIRTHHSTEPSMLVGMPAKCALAPVEDEVEVRRNAEYDGGLGGTQRQFVRPLLRHIWLVLCRRVIIDDVQGAKTRFQL